jgi:hypothetical protein
LLNFSTAINKKRSDNLRKAIFDKKYCSHMFHFRILFVAFIFFNFTFSGSAQENKDTVLLMNGDIVICNVIDTTGGLTSIKNPKNPKKNIILENDRIFSIKSPDGEHIMYVYDTVIGNEFTIDEMRYFMYGERDADNNFKANGCLVIGAAVGLLSGITGSFLCPIPPFAFTALSGLQKVKIRKETVTNLDYLTHDPYLMGYERVAKKKRKLKSLIGGGLGLVVGLGTYGVLKSTGNELY